MPTIGKITSFVIFICLLPLPVFAEEKQSGFGFSVTPSFGIIYGQAKEIVYYPESKRYLSELRWDIMPLFYAGLAADFGPLDYFSKHGFTGNLSFKMGIPQKTGIMVDRDWDDTYWWVDSGTLTNYSRHDNFSERAILADLSLGYSFPLLDIIALGVNFDFSFMHYYWIAKNGYYQYLTPGQALVSEIDPISVEGRVLEYSQNWFILSPGVLIKFRLGRFFSINGNFNYSPLIYCTDKDEHLARNTIFIDHLFYGQYLKGGGGITFSPMNTLDIAFFLSYSSIFGSKGDAYRNNYIMENPAGGGYSAFEFGILARMRLSGL